MINLESTKIICLGDSLTQAKYLPHCERWTSLVSNKLNVQILNKGVSGDTTTGMLGRFYNDVVNSSPNYVFIMGGSNDLWFNVDYTQILANVFSMIRQAQYNGIIPIIGLPTPLDEEILDRSQGYVPYCTFANCKSNYINYKKELISMLEVDGVDFIDVSIGFSDENDSTYQNLYIEDGLHPNSEGNTIMANNVSTKLIEIINKYQ